MRVSIAVALLSVAPTVGHEETLVCPARECLPKDTANRENGDTLCYTSTGHTQAFAQCNNPAKPVCTMCTTGPPCESWCEAEVYEALPMGSPCHLDRECGGDALAQCHVGTCKRVLWAGQACDARDEHSVCINGGLQCVQGICQGLGTNEPCWDGYPDGQDLDCKVGWYCLRGVCVPQLPDKHTCRGDHPNECLIGHLCNLQAERPQCMREFSLPVGAAASSNRLCESSTLGNGGRECIAAFPFDLGSGAECFSADDCKREDGTNGECSCKRWWSGEGAPGFCEWQAPHRQRPWEWQLYQKRIASCHHAWPEERCVAELGEEALYELVERERQATSDPTLPIPSCATDIITFFGNTFRKGVPVLAATLPVVLLSIWHAL